MKRLLYVSMILAGALFLYESSPLSQEEKRAKIKAIASAMWESVAGALREQSPDSTQPPAVAGDVPLDVDEPKVETLEELTKNWTVIPPSAFPRQVKLLREAVFKSAAGSSKLPAGTAVVALACDKGVLNLAPEESSPVRGMARVSDTDLKTQFHESYSKWAAMRADALRQQAQNRRQPEVGPADVPGEIDETGKPVRSADGTYPVLLASMKSGQVTDITPKKIKMWGTPQLATMEGKPTWVIDVNYDTIVFCGPLEARAQAHIRDGRVIRWVYPGSGEQVP